MPRAKNPVDPVQSLVAQARERRRRTRYVQERMIASVHGAFQGMGMTVQIGNLVLGQPDVEAEPPEQTYWAQRLASGAVVFVFTFGHYTSGRSIVRYEKLPVEQVLDVEAIVRTAPDARIYGIGQGPWPEILGNGGHFFRVLVEGKASRETLTKLITKGLAFQPRFQDPHQYMTAAVIGPLPMDWPMKLARHRREKRALEQLEATVGADVAVLGEAKAALTNLVFLEGAPGSQRLTEAWREPLDAFIRDTLAAKATLEIQRKTTDNAYNALFRPKHTLLLELSPR